MAKKSVATFRTGDGRSYSKVIKMVKSPKTGAYTFQEAVSYTHLGVNNMLWSSIHEYLPYIEQLRGAQAVATE